MTVDLASRLRDDESEVAAAPRAAALAPAPHVARVLALQRGAGNAAVARMLAARQPPPRASRMLARDPVAAPTAPAPAGAAGAPPSPLADLATRAGSAAGLRAMVAANPALANQIVSYLATTDDPALNGLMAQAFPADAAPAAPQPAADGAPAPETAVEKNPTDPKVKLPDPIPDEKTLDKGHMKWTLRAENHSKARVDVEFKPDETKVEAKNVSFGQTVINKVGDKLAYAGGTLADPALEKATFQPFEDPASKKRMDHFPQAENDPFYGAEWDQSAKKWKRERDDWLLGSSTKGKESSVASMFDRPEIPFAREGLGDTSIEFETVPMILETRQPLGSLKWGFKTKDSPQSPIELTGGTKADCVDTPSADWSAAMDQFYKGKFEEILDDFDIAKAVLKDDHKTKLDSIVTKMKATVTLKAQLGGAADLTGDAKFNQALSLKRAQAARDYLVAKGIDAGRLELQSYGADWARVEAEAGTSEGKNRRVQIWLH